MLERLCKEHPGEEEDFDRRRRGVVFGSTQVVLSSCLDIYYLALLHHQHCGIAAPLPGLVIKLMRRQTQVVCDPEKKNIRDPIAPVIATINEVCGNPPCCIACTFTHGLHPCHLIYAHRPCSATCQRRHFESDRFTIKPADKKGQLKRLRCQFSCQE